MPNFGDKVVLDTNHKHAPIMHIYENSRVACFPKVGDIKVPTDIMVKKALE